MVVVPSSGPQYVIQDPYHEYAARFMELMHRDYGWRAVCMYTDPTALRMNGYAYPLLRSPEYVAADYRVTRAGIPAFAAHLRAAHDVRAVIPHYEPSVVPAAELAAELGLSWAQPRVIRRFRDKRLLKAAIVAADPSLRVNPGHLVGSAAEALRIAARHGMKRFVTKPNDGFGNVAVSFFDVDDDPARLEAHWADTGASTLLLEEFIRGQEYHCDGQVEADGTVLVTDAMRYLRGEFLDRQNIELGSVQVRHDTELFRVLADYTTRVLRASGLRRSPFHAEVKIDDRGPCLIECAARLVGAHTAPLVNVAHGGSLDVFALAAHYYVTAQPYGDPGLDWATYDSRLFGQVCGLSPRTERVYSLRGVDEAERLPGFLRWLKPIRVGDRLHATTDIFGSAYIVATQGVTEEDLELTRQEILRLVRWNTKPQRMRDVTRAGAALARRRSNQLPTWRESRMPRFDG